MIMGGLLALRFVAEGVGREPVTPATRHEMMRLARSYLTQGTWQVVTLWRAIDLAVALGDPELREIVESYATDPQMIVARGVNDPDLIERTQREARERLAGVEPLPRWQDYTRGDP